MVTDHVILRHREAIYIIRGRSQQHRRARLLKRTVDAAKPQPARYDLWDDSLTGFALRVAPDGTKSFFVRYRLRGQGRASPKRFMSIGRYGAITVDQARETAQSILRRCG